MTGSPVIAAQQFCRSSPFSTKQSVNTHLVAVYYTTWLLMSLLQVILEEPRHTLTPTNTN